MLEDIGVQGVDSKDVHACHRLGNTKKTIIRFVKNAVKNALHNKKKLAEINGLKFKLAKELPGLFINESLRRPMQFLLYKVRTAFKQKKISSYNFWKDKLALKADNVDHIIIHINDSIDLNHAVVDDREAFFN